MRPFQGRCRNVGSFNENLGSRLRAFRLARNLTQSAVAQAAGVTFQQIQKYERGINGITADRIVAICCILEVTPLEFLGWESSAPCFRGDEGEASANARLLDQDRSFYEKNNRKETCGGTS